MFSGLGFRFGGKREHSASLQQSISARQRNDRIYDWQTEMHRTVHVEKGPDGYGFVLSVRIGDKLKPTAAEPSLHFFEAVKVGAAAMQAGIKPGDYLLRINGHDVRNLSHSRVVKLISNSKDDLVLEVVRTKKVMKDTQSEYRYGQAERLKMDRYERTDTPNHLSRAFDRMYLGPSWNDMSIKPRQRASRRINTSEIKRHIIDGQRYHNEDMSHHRHNDWFSSMPSAIPQYPYEVNDLPKTLIPRVVLKHNSKNDHGSVSNNSIRTTYHDNSLMDMYEDDELDLQHELYQPEETVKHADTINEKSVEHHEYVPQIPTNLSKPTNPLKPSQAKSDESASKESSGFEAELRNAVAQRRNRMKQAT